MRYRLAANATAVFIAAAVLALAATPAWAIADLNTFTVRGTVAAIITQTEQVGFTVPVNTSDILIPCLESTPIAGCEQVEVGDYVIVHGHFGDYQAAGDDTLYNTLVLDEVWVCEDIQQVRSCTLLVPETLP